jgi:peptidoglycan/xylan/chitin deacetylase (PgdA/CDA1 family)
VEEFMSKSIKRKLANTVSTFLVSSGITDIYRNFEKKARSKKVRILNYHRILDIEGNQFPYYEKNVSCSPSVFEMQMRYVKTNFNVISLSEYVNARQEGTAIPISSVIITFDDGYADFYDNAYPILKRHNIPATLFVTTGFVGKGKLYWWDEISFYIKQSGKKMVELPGGGPFWLRTTEEKRRASEKISDELTTKDEQTRRGLIDQLADELDAGTVASKDDCHYVTWEMLTEMESSNVEIGGHSNSHPNLRKLSDDDLLTELTTCRERIEEALKQQITLFAYPYGHEKHVDERVKTAVREAGFTCGCTTIYGSVSMTDDPYMLKRIPIFYYNSLSAMKAKVSGIFDYLYRR